ncbi:YndM family protein [Virgibacillus dakarensis]|nr:YndM family protein [Virgibacillus dakarensis]
MFWISLFVTGISYLIGDLFMLRRFGNIAASIADFPLAFLSLWVLGTLLIESSIPIVMLSLMAAFFITFCEPFIHTYIIENQLSDDGRTDSPKMSQLQTEFAEETDGQTITNKEKHDS